MQLYTIETGYFKLDGGAMFGVVPKVLWSRTNPADENNLCPWAMRSLLIEDGDKLILIDNGIGFNEFGDKIKQILNPYYTTKKNGTGLGLSIVNKIINDHNGNIKFISIKDGAKIEAVFLK